VEARIAGQRGLERLEPRGPLEPGGDRTAGAAALVGGSDHAGVGPDLRVQRVAGTEHADDGPVLAADVQRVARLQPGELALRADAGDQLAAAGLEPAALDQLDVGPHRPGAFS